MRNLQEYHRPTTASEAYHLKRRYGAEAAYIAGGSDLLVHRSPMTRAVIDIRFAGLSGVRVDDIGNYHIGAATRLRDAESAVSEIAGGMLRVALRETAPWLVRNTATVAGNLANASPAADSVPALIALDAEIDLFGQEAETVPADDILSGPHQTTLEDRLIVSIRIPARAITRRADFHKHARSKSDIAQVNAAVSLLLTEGKAHDVRIVLGAVAPTAMRARQAEALLEDESITEATIRRVGEAVCDEVRPISDWRAGADYRRRISGVLVQRALRRIAGRGLEG